MLSIRPSYQSFRSVFQHGVDAAATAGRATEPTSAAATSSAQASDFGRSVRWLLSRGINGGFWCTRRTSLRRGCKASVSGPGCGRGRMLASREMRAIRELSLAAPLAPGRARAVLRRRPGRRLARVARRAARSLSVLVLLASRGAARRRRSRSLPLAALAVWCARLHLPGRGSPTAPGTTRTARSSTSCSRPARPLARPDARARSRRVSLRSSER